LDWQNNCGQRNSQDRNSGIGIWIQRPIDENYKLGLSDNEDRLDLKLAEQLALEISGAESFGFVKTWAERVET